MIPKRTAHDQSRVIYCMCKSSILKSRLSFVDIYEGGFFHAYKREIQDEKSDCMGFSYKEQYAVVVICENEKDQETIYNRLKEEGYKLKVVAV